MHGFQYQRAGHEMCRIVLILMLFMPPLLPLAAADSYVAELEAWKRERLAELKGDSGYLNLAGLYWLRQPESTFGSAMDNDLPFPASAEPHIGVFHLNPDQVVLTVNPGVSVNHMNAPVTRIRMHDDSSDTPVTVTHGSLSWTVINRDGKFAVRLRDFEHPALRNFPPIDYYPVNVELNVRAALQPYEEPRQVRVDTVIEGLDYKPMAPGILYFSVGGEEFELEPYLTSSGLLLIFGDRTSGRETYPAGRFLYAKLPDENGQTMLDFNKAENPPCAFNEFATCPVASTRNRLDTRVEAGERFDPSRH